jgi:hypothetical protein
VTLEEREAPATAARRRNRRTDRVELDVSLEQRRDVHLEVDTHQPCDRIRVAYPEQLAVPVGDPAAA